MPKTFIACASERGACVTRMRVRSSRGFRLRGGFDEAFLLFSFSEVSGSEFASATAVSFLR